MNAEDCVVGGVVVGIGYAVTAVIIGDAMTMMFAVTTEDFIVEDA